VLPHLAARLRLSTTSDDEDSPTHAFDADEPSQNNSPTRYNHTPLPTAETDASDRERIERSLVEMMSRQRQRVGGGKSAEGEGRTREEEELLGLIVGSLREKVGVMEGEGWMYGERWEGGEGIVQL
jgi:hypothetical protein